LLSPQQIGTICLSFFLVFIFPAFSNTELSGQIQYKEQLVRELKEEIQQIDSEMARCQKVKKGWVAATVVGGVGVVATGAAAIAQTVGARKKAENLKAKEPEAK
jgi:hypothetical protein